MAVRKPLVIGSDGRTSELISTDTLDGGVTNNADGGQISGGTIARILKWLGADITLTGSGANTHTFPSVSSTLIGNDTLKITTLSADAPSNSTVTAAKITSLDTAAGVGTYKFEYWIRYQSSATTTGVKFSVFHSGTVSAFMANMRYVDAASTASTGAPSQNANASTAQVMGAYSSRAMNNAAAIGPTLSADTANADMLVVIEGLVIVTGAGDLQLFHASEVAAATTVKAVSTLILIKIA